MIKSSRQFLMGAAALALFGALSPAAMAADQVSFFAADTVDAKNMVIYLDPSLNLPSDMESGMETALDRAIEASGFEGAFGTHKTFYGLGEMSAITVIGTGEDALTRRQLHDLGGHAVGAPGKDSLTILTDGLNTTVAAPSAELALGYKLGSYRFDSYKTGEKPKSRDVVFAGEDAQEADRLMEADYEGLADAISMTRDFGSAPGLEIYPETFVDRVRNEARGIPNLKITVMGVREMERNNMGGILGVGKGSVHDPSLLILEYTGAGRSDAPIALVGKGITFDTGGISLKPNNGQWLMKSDLSGAAAVAGTLIATAKRGANVNVVGLMPLAENMPGSRAIRPGDVLTTFNGKTIEVMSTDAEGRLLLADAVPYAIEEYDPELVVNVATLTGSAARALGDDYGAVITRDFELSEAMMDIGKRSGEDVWPLPLNDSHFKQIKSDIADIRSTAGSPGASIGAAVVGTFVEEDQPWVHIDFAGVDWRDSATPTAPKGHAGWGVRFMDQLVRDYEEK